MNLSSVSTRKIAGITGALSKVNIGKDAVSHIARRLVEKQKEWRERPLKKGYTHLYLDAIYLKVQLGRRRREHGSPGGYGGRRRWLYRSVGRGGRGGSEGRGLRFPPPPAPPPELRGVRSEVSDDHEGIKATVASELPGVEWQRCVVHFQRNVLVYVPAQAMADVAEDLSAIFKVGREKTSLALAEEFVDLHWRCFPKATSVFEAGISDTVTYLSYPGSHHTRLRSTNMPERLFKEVKRKIRVVGILPNETSAATLVGEIALRSSEEWALKRYLTIDALEAMKNRIHTIRDVDVIGANTCLEYVRKKVVRIVKCSKSEAVRTFDDRRYSTKCFRGYECLT
jgi:putative transposase